jgi:hypothetical protein
MQATLVLALLLAGSAASAAYADCYTIFDARNRIVYRSEISPVDLSGPISTSVNALYRGGQLVISGDNLSCTVIGPRSPADPMTGAAATTDPAPGATRTSVGKR